MKELTNTKRGYAVDLPRSQSRVYLRSDTLFLQHITEKRLSQQSELNKGNDDGIIVNIDS